MVKTPTGNRHQTIHCNICGEDYAATYKRCPFCNGRPPEEEDTTTPRRTHGRRMSTNRRGGGYSSGQSPLKMVRIVLSLALIVAAVCILVSYLKPIFGKDKPTTTPTPLPSPTATVSPTADPDVTPSPTVPADQTATGFTLDKGDFTLSFYGESHPITAAFSPAGSKGYLQWTSSNPEVVSVDENGNVKAIGKVNGISRATITATLKGTQISQSCTVRCSFDAPANAGTTTTAPSTSPNSSGTVGTKPTLSTTDFTMPPGTTVQMRVSGTTSTPTWSMGNTAVAKVSDSGLVTMVSKGTPH